MSDLALAVSPAPLAVPQLAPGTAARLIEAFLAGRNARTMVAYRGDLEHFRAFIGADDVGAATSVLLGAGAGEANGMALGYRNAMVQEGLAPATVNRRLAALRSLVKLGRILGMIPWALEVQNVRASRYRDVRGPGREGVGKMMSALAARHDAKGVRDIAILHFLLDLGLRRSEVVSLDLEHLDLAGARASVQRKGHGNERQWLTLPAYMVEAIRAWLAVRGIAPGPLFVHYGPRNRGARLAGGGLYYLVRELGSEVGLKTRPHALRHTAITETSKLAQAAGYTLEDVCQFSGHADVRTLMIYRDAERDLQGKLATLLSNSFWAPR